MKTVIGGIVGGIIVLIGMLLLRPAAPVPAPIFTRMAAVPTATKAPSDWAMELSDIAKKYGVDANHGRDNNEREVLALSTRVADLEKKNCPYEWVPC